MHTLLYSMRSEESVCSVLYVACLFHFENMFWLDHHPPDGIMHSCISYLLHNAHCVYYGMHIYDPVFVCLFGCVVIEWRRYLWMWIWMCRYGCARLSVRQPTLLFWMTYISAYLCADLTLYDLTWSFSARLSVWVSVCLFSVVGLGWLDSPALCSFQW